jgi:hypothetical protein
MVQNPSACPALLANLLIGCRRCASAQRHSRLTVDALDAWLTS